MSRQQITASTSGCNGSVKLAVFAALAVALTILTLASAAYAQTFVTLHDFARGTDGGYPYAGLTIDRAGNLYGTASQGGNLNACYHSGCGTVFKLEHKPSGWIYSVLYAFSGPDGQYPETRVSFAPDGSLYGTTSVGGPSGYGEVFRLQPPLRPCRSVSCPWRETLVHSFSGGSDGAYPTYGDLAFDHAGNIYGTTPYGGDPNCGGGSGCGVVYKLSPSSGGWTETILYAFHNGNDGGTPFAGVVFDSSGNIYGTNSAGVVYELSPAAGGWVETTLTNLCSCFGGLTFDSAGNLYGVSFLNFENGGPGVFELSPSNGGWRIQELYDFAGAYEGSLAQVSFDQAGNLYGTMSVGSPEVFRLTQQNGQWTLTGFAGQDGGAPYGNVVLDGAGNIYSTTNAGGGHSAGVVFEITP